ncbi:MAG: hypothetical protein ABEJ99_05815 [Candidatus Nanohaloarchaea archaeon]
MPQQDLINQIVNRVNDFNRRVRNLEEKIRNLNARVNTLDDTILNKTKDISNDMQDLEEDLSELRDRIANMEVDIKEINREKRKYVTSQELEEIENYMDLMNPIQSSFATKKEVKEMIGDKEGVSKNEIEKMIDRKIKRLQDKSSDEDSQKGVKWD